MTEFHGEIFTAIQIQTRAFNLVSFPNPLVLEVKWVSETEQVNPLLLSPELSFFLPQCALSPRKVQVVHADLVRWIILEAKDHFLLAPLYRPKR